MPYIVMTSVYPSDKQNAVAETYLENAKNNPPRNDLTEQVIPLAISRSHDGINTMVVSKVKQGKLEEALADISKRMFAFNKVPGYECSMRVWSTMEEAFAVANIPLSR